MDNILNLFIVIKFYVNFKQSISFNINYLRFLSPISGTLGLLPYLREVPDKPPHTAIMDTEGLVLYQQLIFHTKC